MANFQLKIDVNSTLFITSSDMTIRDLEAAYTVLAAKVDCPITEEMLCSYINSTGANWAEPTREKPKRKRTKSEIARELPLLILRAAWYVISLCLFQIVVVFLCSLLYWLWATLQGGTNLLIVVNLALNKRSLAPFKDWWVDYKILMTTFNVDPFEQTFQEWQD